MFKEYLNSLELCMSIDLCDEEGGGTVELVTNGKYHSKVKG